MKKSTIKRVYYIYPSGGTETNNAIFEGFNLQGLKGNYIVYNNERLFVWILSEMQLKTLLNSAHANNFKFLIFEKAGEDRYVKVKTSKIISSECVKAQLAIKKAGLEKRGNGGIIQRELRNIRNRKIKSNSGFNFHYDRATKRLIIFDSDNNPVTHDGAESVGIKIPKTEAEMMTSLIDFLSALTGKRIKMQSHFENMIFRIE